MLALFAALLLQAAPADAPAGAAPAQERPNVLWLTFEDHGPQLGCYGDDYADTPVLDGLAARGVRYERCWSNAPVCSTARTTLITGRHATSLGAHHHRSRLPCPEGVRFFPQLLREAGYFCTNNRKEDYNLAKPAGTWDMSGGRAHWRHRQPGQPFFAVFNVTVSHESRIRTRPHELVHDPDAFELPPYYPDLPEIRRDWAQEYDKGTEMDAQLGQILAQLEADGLAEDTIVFAFGDHGSGMPRHKRWPGDSGLRVPLILVVPEKWQHLRPEAYQAGALLKRLVAFVDLGPTVLSLCGIEPDDGMQGVPFLGEHAGPPKKYLFGYRGRMDERDDCVRTLTDGRYVYMWTPYWGRPHGTHVAYQMETPTTRLWYEYARDHPEAPAAIRDFWFTPRGPEDLYDLRTDPHEVHDLADLRDHQDVLTDFRERLRAHLGRTQDLGFIPEHVFHARLHDGFPAYQARHADAAWMTSMLLADGPPPERVMALAEREDPVLRWWAAVARREIGRASGNWSAAWDDSESDGGVRVLRAAAKILDQDAALPTPEQSALEDPWGELLAHAGDAQPNYFVRLQAWQAIDECIVRLSRLPASSFPDQQRHALRERLAAIPVEIDGLDRAFRNYIPRLKEKILRELTE